MYVMIFITAANKKDAAKIALVLVKERLAACVNIIEKISSLFRWQGKVDSSKEALLIIKTKRKLVKKLIKKVKSLHSYEVPEIIALPIVAGDNKYLRWINESTS